MFCPGLKFQQLDDPQVLVKIRDGHAVESADTAFIITPEVPLRDQGISLLNDPFDGPFQHTALPVPIGKPLENLVNAMILRAIAFAV